jgi:hypothetical protein
MAVCRNNTASTTACPAAFAGMRADPNPFLATQLYRKLERLEENKPN